MHRTCRLYNRISVCIPGWMWVRQTESSRWLTWYYDGMSPPNPLHLLLLLTSVFSFPLSLFHFTCHSLLCGLGINNSLISLLILFQLTSCYHFVVPFIPPFTRFESAVWDKLQFISTSWQRCAELITGHKWTSRQSQLASAVGERFSNADVHLYAKTFYSLFR